MRTPARWSLALLLAVTVTALAQILTPEEALKQSLAAPKNNKTRALSDNSPDRHGIEIAQPAVTGATFLVNTTADTQDALAGNGICADSTGACSLRAAITEANALPGPDNITLPAGTYTITLPTTGEDINAGGDFDITSPITINGAGSGTTIIQANALPNTAAERVIHCITAATAVVINDVTIRHGNSTTDASGSGIRLETANTNLTLNRVVVTNNRSAGNGGGLSVVTDGIVLKVNDSTISNNSAGSSIEGSTGKGAGIDVSAVATVNITNTIVTGNAINSSVSNTFGAGVSVSGGPDVAGATVTITGSTISNNSSTSTFQPGGGLAGGIYNLQGTVHIIKSTFTGNTASGFQAGVRTFASTGGPATTTITNSSISNNTSTYGGGGVINGSLSTFDAITTITGSTINGNSATDGQSYAGGIENFSVSTGAATVNLTNSTVSGNTAFVGGGTYCDGETATINLNYSTVASNTAKGIGGGLYQEITAGGVTNLKNSVVADNTAGAAPDISGPITSQDYNHIESTDGGIFVALTNDVTGSDPQLGPLADNGGPTATHLPGGTSPVLNTIAGGISECGTTITVDQRGPGFPRPSGAGCDKGSVEGSCPPGSWTAAAPYPTTIAHYGFAQVGEDLYVISGISDGNIRTNAVRRYNATTNVWTSLANIPVPSEAPAAVFFGGKIYVADGSGGGNLIRIYDIAANTWSAGPVRPGAGSSQGAAAGAFNGNVYIVGGGFPASTTLSIYNIAANTWSDGPAAPSPYKLGGYTQIGQFLYMIGSYGNTPAENSTVSVRLDMAANTWSIGPVWTPARADFGLAAVGSKLFAIGGDAQGGSFFDPSVLVDELETSTWPAGAWVASPPNLPTARADNQAGFFSTGRVGGEIWVTGGIVLPFTHLDEHLFRASGVCGQTPAPTPTPPGGTPTPTPAPSATPVGTATPTPAPTATPCPGGSNEIVDGGFENGGIPSSIWDPETSTNFGTPLCDVPTCNTGNGTAGPRSGAIWSWFGGSEGSPETATLGQTVTIPSGGAATLHFYLWIGATHAPFTDVLNVRVDGAVVQSYPEPEVAEGGYTERIIDLSTFANGATHQILFEYIGPDDGNANFSVDDVSLIAGGACPTATPAATPTPASQAINLSTRLRVERGDNVGIGGFIVTGSAPKHVLLRGIGPSLTGVGVPDALADPVMELHGPAGFVTITDDNWRDDPAQAALIKASGIPPTNDLESAIDATLSPGAYTAIVRGKNDTSGVALIEVYDLARAVPAKLANISTRAFVDTGDNIVIAGFILGGNSGNTSVIVRGIGPSLTQFGVPNALADPTLELHNGDGALLASDNNWQDDPAQAAALTAAGLAPTNNLEAGLAATLSPGLYTALLAGLDGGTGVGLVEVYDLGGTP